MLGKPRFVTETSTLPLVGHSLTIIANDQDVPDAAAAGPGPGGATSKRLMDVCVAALLLAMSLPVILGLMLWVALDGGQPLFAHQRIGRDGRSFRCWKIRSMVPGAEAMLAPLLATDEVRAAEWARDFKLTDDPRVTWAGGFLRRSRFDELPQLWNVLVGEMSLVGPRPVTREELLRYGRVAPLYCAVRPGLTGLWQVEGNETTSYSNRVELDRRYILDRSFAGDIFIVLRTVTVMLRRTGH
jgi:exopolysaccharide production protein ExoY